MSITELGYVRFGVSDLAAWRSFAEELLGLEVHPESEGDRLYLRLDDWHHRIILDKDPADDLIGIGLRVAGAQELRDLKQTLREHDVSFEEGSADLARDRAVLELITLEDPAGNPLEIFHGPRVDTHLPFHPGRRMFGRFLTAEGGLGHMIIKHDNLDETWAFYSLLGMRGGVEYQIPLPGGHAIEAMFMDCGERDHSLAFGLPSKGKINHIMFEVDNLDDVMFTYAKVKDRYPIVIDLGKHANDQMFSFYCESPSGFNVEIGYAGERAKHQSQYHVQDTYGHEFLGGGS
ncbi:MAG: VOC family protein [Longimicrobiales bacterium]